MKVSIFIKILDFSPKKYENTRFIANFGQFIAKNIHFLLIYWNLQQKLCGFKKKNYLKSCIFKAAMALFILELFEPIFNCF